jgi:hypothetical protein
MQIRTEPIGSIPRPAALRAALADRQAGRISNQEFQQVANEALRAARFIPGQLGTTDDCGFWPFADDASTSREVAFEKIRTRVVGTAIAAGQLSSV